VIDYKLLQHKYPHTHAPHPNAPIYCPQPPPPNHRQRIAQLESSWQAPVATRTAAATVPCWSASTFGTTLGQQAELRARQHAEQARAENGRLIAEHRKQRLKDAQREREAEKRALLSESGFFNLGAASGAQCAGDEVVGVGCSCKPSRRAIRMRRAASPPPHRSLPSRVKKPPMMPSRSPLGVAGAPHAARAAPALCAAAASPLGHGWQQLIGGREHSRKGQGGGGL